MQVAQEAKTYKIWAVDNLVYGPIDIAALINWVHEGRVLPETWVHTESANCWVRAKDFPVLREHFPDVGDTVLLPRAGQVRAEELRQFPVFSGLSNGDLEQFFRFAETQCASEDEVILRKGSPCDAAYFLVSGEVSARLGESFEDTTLARIHAGDFFGEIGMFTQSTRTADVVAESDVRLLRISAEAFQLMMRQIPRLAAPLLFAICKSMAQRIADGNGKLQQETSSTFLWR